MNQQLYDQFLDAASVIVGVQEFDVAITNKKDEWGNLCELYVDTQNKVKEAHKSYGKWQGWGTFFLIFGLCNTLLFTIAIITTTAEFIMSGRPISLAEMTPFVVIMIILLVMAFFGIYLIISAKTKRKRRVKKVTKEVSIAEVELQQEIDKIESDIHKFEEGLQKFVDETCHFLDFLPNNYRNPQAVGFMLKAIENLRANTLTDVINLYEQELHFMEQRRILEDTAEMQRIHNENMMYAMESINRNQERTNANLNVIQAMQFISMLSD